MSYAIGQFRRDTLNTYLNKINFIKQEIQTSSSDISEDIAFTDIAFKLEGGVVFDKNKNYYFKLQIKKTQYNQNFQVTLQNIENQNTSVQKIKNFYISAKQEQEINDIVVINIVFNPIVNFTHLVLRLSRTYEDFLIIKQQGQEKKYGRLIEINDEGCEFFQIKNILDSLNGISQFKKIGIQGPSGLLMCINGEEIRIGPSGIYQIKNGYKINFMGFIITSENSSDDYFILDYQYEKGGN